MLQFLRSLLQNLKRDRGIREGEVDLIAGGPPCQGYSGIGHRRSYAVDKKELPSNHLYKDMALIVRRVRPRMFLFRKCEGLVG